MRRIDVHSTTTARSGIGGWIELGLRKTRTIFHGLVLLPLYGLACICVGIGLIPASYFYEWAVPQFADFATPLRYASTGMVFGTCFFITGFTMIFLIPAVNFVFRVKLKAWRGQYYSLEAIPWYFHNSATYLLRYTFLEFITPGPYSNWFYQMMGMKIGRGTVLNTTNISDPSLIEMGDKVTIGGSVTIVAHYGQSGFLVIAPVKIGDGATIGLKATIMGGVTIGKGAKVLPNSVVLPNTVIPDGETWGGVPAVKFNPLSRVA